MKALRVAVFAFVPVALYGLYQSVNGLSRFEIMYLNTGLTSEIRQFGESIFRVFSTLNSAYALSVMMGILVVIVIAPRGEAGKGGALWWRIPLALLFAATSFITFTRTGWLAMGAGLVALVVVRTHYE